MASQKQENIECWKIFHVFLRKDLPALHITLRLLGTVTIKLGNKYNNSFNKNKNKNLYFLKNYEIVEGVCIIVSLYCVCIVKYT